MHQPSAKRSLPTVELDAKMRELVEGARADLTQRLEPAQPGAENIKLSRAERVTWRSSALGCPLPDRGYKMVLVPGVLIQLRAEGTNYEYHSTLRGPAFLCEPPGSIETPAPRNDSRDPT